MRIGIPAQGRPVRAMYGLADAASQCDASAVQHWRSELAAMRGCLKSPELADRLLLQSSRFVEGLGPPQSAEAPVPKDFESREDGVSNDIGVDELWRSILLALSWVSTKLEFFAIKGSFSAEFDKRDVARLKPLSELALTLDLLDRCGVRFQQLKDVASWIWREIHEGALIARIVLARPDFIPCSAIVASMNRLGFSSSTLTTAIHLVSSLDMTARLPLQPWVHLALRYNLNRLGVPERDEQRNEKDLYVIGMPEPWIISDEIAYAITHEVFYLTDFGFGPGLSQPVQDYLGHWLPYWADVYEKQLNADLLGEFSMCWAALHQWPECLHSSPLHVVLARQDSSGAVPGPAGAGSVLFADDDSKERRDFLATYHTTLVSIMACALMLRRVHAGRSR